MPERMKEKEVVTDKLARRQMEWIGHILLHERLLKLIIKKSLDKKNQNKKPEQKYIQQIKKNQGCISYVQINRIADDSNEWRRPGNQFTD